MLGQNSVHKLKLEIKRRTRSFISSLHYNAGPEYYFSKQISRIVILQITIVILICRNTLIYNIISVRTIFREQSKAKSTQFSCQIRHLYAKNSQ
ncbi:hypothetical protein IMG5_124150 [Ichthyophthirius multifiliis]|uniref:Uncharacterized protein n=1 Tax=Ichthyophthirius multifiliis TaxID=5932 RepID=G0QVI9_ICHMU|nr:hypothetical protein IMG5_124150 [Ichthyophthirius multifiliis]EGR30749.1 hypothetical protein IMG5_124150 [Ichthyophthirius multifiliis]|eukprot:XP_004032336.1 hypothetical protein IMG5_124150 [Ichthyophthirius multifiliis]